MTIEEKKIQVCRLLRLGMGQDEAELLAEFTLEEQEALIVDASYQNRCRVQKFIEERSLLIKLDDIIEQNALVGKSSEIRWKLERMNPSRWGKTVSVVTPNISDEKPIDLGSMTPEARAALLDAVSAAMGGDKEDE